MKPVHRPIGGFFALEPPFKPVARDFLKLWGASDASMLAFHTARSALRHLVETLEPPVLWSPAYMSPTILETVVGLTAQLQFYPLKEDLSPDVEFLGDQAKKGDAVLAVDYFGKNPGKAFLDFVKQRKDIIWIEDRAQGILPAKMPWGDYTVYSLRKILGVPDGGLLVRHGKKKLSQPKWQPLPDASFVTASLLRYEDEEERHNGVWYRAYLEQEDRVGAGCYPMSRLSSEILRATDPFPIIERRKANYTILAKALGRYTLFPKGMGSAVPYGFPVRLKDRDKVARKLAQARVFAARYWPDIPAPESFTFEHFLAAEILLLPCDHRYSEKEMKRVIKTFKEAVR